MSLSEHPYVRAAIDGEVGNLASAVEGIRNQTLFKSTANLASLGLREGEILHHLKPAAEQIGLRGSEFYTTVKSGVRSGSSRPRQIPDIVRRASPNASASPPHPQPETSNAAGVQGDEPTLIFIADIEGPPVWADEMRRHIYRQDSLPVQIKIKRASGRYVNWYSVIRDGRTGWQPAKPEGYIACPYIGAVDPFDPGLADRLLYWRRERKTVTRWDVLACQPSRSAARETVCPTVSWIFCETATSQSSRITTEVGEIMHCAKRRSRIQLPDP